MKKSILLTLVFILVVSLCTLANAYSTNNYSFDVPSTWSSAGQAGVYKNSEGNGVNVQITKFAGDAGNPYTEENLKVLVNTVENDLDTYRDELAASLKQTYGLRVTDAQIKQYVSSFRCKSVDLSEITTCSKNNYKCFHIVANYELKDYSYYCNQYSIVSGNEIYTLTLSAEDKDDFDTEEMKSVVDSFTIKNYQEPKGGSSILMWTLIGAGIGAVVGVIVYFLNKNKNKSDNGLNG